jgi:hypothetical protein
MINKRLSRKFKKLNNRKQNDITAFQMAFPAFLRESIREVIVLSQMMARSDGAISEYAKVRIRETYPMPESEFSVGSWVMQHNISQEMDEFVISGSFKNQTVLPVIERLKQSSLENVIRINE